MIPVLDATYIEGQPLRLDPGPQLLLDDHLVEDRFGLERVLQPPQKHLGNPILMRDKPWEGDVAYRPCVIEDEGRYRMWYQCFSFTNYYGAGGSPYFVAYAESEDGFEWTKPRLDVCAGYEGTNIVYVGTHYARVQGVQVWRDTSADATQRYRMICVERSPDPAGHLASGVHLCVSPDGLSWTIDGPPLLDYHSDCHNHVVRDEIRDRWLLYCRPIVMSAVGRRYPRFMEGGRHTRRRVAVSTSTDLRTFTYPRTCLTPDEIEPHDIDSCCVFRYASHFLMLYASMEGEVTGTNEGRLATSPDGIHWQRFHSAEPFLARGAEGSWDAGQVIPAEGPLQRVEEMLFYYSGFTKPQYDPARSGGIGLAIGRSAQFVEQRGGDPPGYLLTREFVWEGSGLRLNTIMRGMPCHEQAIHVEIARRPQVGGHAGHVQTLPGYALEDCDPVRGTRTDAPVSWNGDADLSALKGQALYLRFEIRNMGLFSFSVDP